MGGSFTRPAAAGRAGAFSAWSLLLGLVFVACTPPARTLQSTILTPASASIAAGQTQLLLASGRYSDGASEQLTTGLAWASSDTEVVTVDGSGVARGIASGSATITATHVATGLSGSAALTVTPAVLQAVTVSPDAPTIVVGLNQRFTATGHYSDGESVPLSSGVTWSSSNADVATIDGSGLAHAFATGSVDITATSTASGISGHGALTITAPTAPTVVSTSPSQGSQDYLVGGLITARFSEDMEAATLDGGSFQVFTGGLEVPGTVSYASRVASFAPAIALAIGATYEVTLAASVRSQSGLALAQPYTWSFRSAGPAGWNQPVRIGSTQVLGGVVHPVLRLGAELYAAWEHVGAARVEIRVSRLGGSTPHTWIGEGALDAGTGDADRPRLAVGNVIATVLWNQGGVLYASQAGSAVDTWSSPRPVSDSGSAPDAATHRIGCDTNGNAVAVWSSRGRIYAAEYAQVSDLWSAPFRVDASGGQDPSVSVDAFGDTTVVWERDAVVYGASKSRMNGLWAPEAAISTAVQVAPVGGKLRPDVIHTLYDGMVVTWAGAVAGSPGSTHVRARRWNSGVWQPEVTVWSAPGLLSDPAPHLDPLGGPDFLLTWVVRGDQPKAGVAIFTGGAWQAPSTSLLSGAEVSGSIWSTYQPPPRSLLVTAHGSVDLSTLVSPSSAWSTVSLGTGDAAAVSYDGSGAPVVIWSAAVGATGIFAARW